MFSLNELLEQKNALEKQIAEVRERELSAAITKVRALIEEFELSESDVFPGGKAKVLKVKVKNVVAAKYRDPESGKTWSGRGLVPKWLSGKNKEDYLIQ